jgi:hypothetical protein
MTLDSLKNLVEQRGELFHGSAKATQPELLDAEARLNHRLPDALRWLLAEHGYSNVCGLDSLDDAVEVTIRCRRAINLPEHIVVLNDWNDAGVVYLDYGQISSSGDVPVFWVGTHNFSRLAEGATLDNDVDSYSNYAAWVLSRVVEHGQGGL